ncbi:hypothetical protein QFW77_10600 [Luteimonas sp. RD2P54]|uniref:Uncharacterized protein n=1 Tax=Luteimonas endophytica TaxID=3042023 RepID=A0ABT6J9D6_9GAMM|nr:hypothetical protein [Luteimonas endophytica]MDH5823435.1 hypothetical protein [Luteimonas endophytica]
MTRAGVLALAVIACIALPSASASDRLSGRYRPLGDPSAPAGEAGQLRVEPIPGGGWRAWFRGQPLELVRATPDQMAGLFPGVGAGRGLECGLSAAFLLCRVEPGTYFPRDGFQSGSGYFSVLADAGLFELERVDGAGGGDGTGR